jgi:hypothetical protein
MYSSLRAAFLFTLHILTILLTFLKQYFFHFNILLYVIADSFESILKPTFMRALLATAIIPFALLLNGETASRKPVTEIISSTISPVNDTARGKIQVVFALDATGSMSGLIAAAKEKIWSIAGSFSQADPAPDIEMGLIFYRDRGDRFVTQLHQLSGNLDDIYEKLMEIRAEGGGDQPESVNQGLFEAVTKFNWASDTSTFKTIFIQLGQRYQHVQNYFFGGRLSTTHGL